MKTRSDFPMQKQIVAALGGSKEGPVDMEYVSPFKTDCQCSIPGLEW